MAEASQGTPQDARSFVADFVPNPDVLKSMPDDQVVAYRERLNQSITKHGPKVVAFGDGWRKAVAGDDEKELKQLERYASPADVWKKARALEQRITSGELRSVPTKDAAPEAVAAWRAENGIPESADKYEVKLKDGFVIGDEDKPIIESFLKSAHGKNLTNDQASAAVEWYYEDHERQVQERHSQDQELAKKTEDELRKEWGNDYRANENRVMSLLDQAPQGLKEKFMGGRLADGTPIMASAEAKKWLAQLSREIDPASTVVPNAGGNVSGAIDDEIAALTKLSGDRSSSYWKGPLDTNGETKEQRRLRDLNDAKIKMGKKAG